MTAAQFEASLATLQHKLSLVHEECAGLGETPEGTPDEIAAFAMAGAIKYKNDKLAAVHAEISDLAKAFLIRNTDHNFKATIGGVAVNHFVQKQFDAGFYRSKLTGPAADAFRAYEDVYKPAEAEARKSGEWSQYQDRLTVTIPKAKAADLAASAAQ